MLFKRFDGDERTTGWLPSYGHTRSLWLKHRMFSSGLFSGSNKITCILMIPEKTLNLIFQKGVTILSADKFHVILEYSEWNIQITLLKPGIRFNLWRTMMQFFDKQLVPTTFDIWSPWYPPSLPRPLPLHYCIWKDNLIRRLFAPFSRQIIKYTQLLRTEGAEGIRPSFLGPAYERRIPSLSRCCFSLPRSNAWTSWGNQFQTGSWGILGAKWLAQGRPDLLTYPFCHHVWNTWSDNLDTFSATVSVNKAHTPQQNLWSALLKRIWIVASFEHSDQSDQWLNMPFCTLYPWVAQKT